jgi:hypothetical protein
MTPRRLIPLHAEWRGRPLCAAAPEGALIVDQLGAVTCRTCARALTTLASLVRWEAIPATVGEIVQAIPLQ